MANLLLDPNLWDDAYPHTTPPPAMWNGTTYAVSYADDASMPFELAYVPAAPAPAPGDTVSGTITVSQKAGDVTAMVLVYMLQDSPYTTLDSVPLTPGVPTAFEFAAADGAMFVIAATSTPGGSGPAFYYGLNATLSPSQSAGVSYNCECDEDHPTQTLAQMRTWLLTRLGFNPDVLMPGTAALINSFLIDAQEQIYRKYRVFRLERFFTWPLEIGVRFYDLADNEDACTKKLDPRMVTWVGISQGDNFWRPLICGIKPEFYYGDVTSIPTHYEIRQCIEVWPPPGDADWKLRIKGYFGLLPFAADDDVTTIDPEAIKLFALANAKAHFQQGDAPNYMQQFKDLVANYTAGSHHTRRYVPGADVYVTPPLPVLTGYPGDP